jgi:hypothetical protein
MVKSPKARSKSKNGQPRLVGRTDPKRLLGLFDEWMRGDAEEQRETFQFLKAALDENRPEGYKHFS